MTKLQLEVLLQEMREVQDKVEDVLIGQGIIVEEDDLRSDLLLRELLEKEQEKIFKLEEAEGWF